MASQRRSARQPRGAGPRGAQKLGDVVAALMARQGYAQMETSEDRLAAWYEAAGTLLGRHSRPGNLRRGILEVIVRNSSVLQELTFQKSQLLSRLADLLPDQPIQDLRFRVGQVD